jgi:hypothetical protein
MSLQEWQARPSESDPSSSDPGQSSIQSGPRFSRDLKSLVVLILLIGTISGVIYEWVIQPQRDHQPRDTPKSAPNVAPAAKLSPLRPFCSPEQDDCWR